MDNYIFYKIYFIWWCFRFIQGIVNNDRVAKFNSQNQYFNNHFIVPVRISADQ